MRSNVLIAAQGAILLIALIISVIPFLVHAQSTDTELRATIEGALLTDPRTKDMPQEKIDEMVNALTSDAQAQGVTVRDLTWRPRTAASFLPQFIPEQYRTGVDEQPDWCAGVPAELCMFGVSFGLIGSAYGIPIVLGLVSMVLIVVLAFAVTHHRKATDSLSS